MLRAHVLARRSLARRALSAIALAALASAAMCGGAGCGIDEPAEPTEPDDRVIVKLSFDEVAYADAAITTRKMIERVRRQNESIFSTLRRADVMITAKRAVDVDLAHLEKDPVTVVDLDSGITRAALRLRYHFVALALAPKALAIRGEVPLGALHIPTPRKPEEVLATCTANGERERAAMSELWTVFDARIPACAATIAMEDAAISVARRRLEHPEREIVTIEFERLTVPVSARLVMRETRGEEPAPGANAASGAGGGQPVVKQLTWVDKAHEKDLDAEDERELSRLTRQRWGGHGQPDQQRYWGYSVYNDPNYTLLWVSCIALVLLLVGWRQQDKKRHR